MDLFDNMIAQKSFAHYKEELINQIEDCQGQGPEMIVIRKEVESLQDDMNMNNEERICLLN